MTAEQVDLFTAWAEDERERGAALASTRAGDWWLSCARRAFAQAAAESYLAGGRPFVAYDVAEQYAVPEPPGLRAWGAVATWASRRGLVEHAGYVPGTRPGSHGAPVSRWRGTRKALDPVKSGTAPLTACDTPTVRRTRRTAPERTT